MIVAGAVALYTVTCDCLLAKAVIDLFICSFHFENYRANSIITASYCYFRVFNPASAKKRFRVTMR